MKISNMKISVLLSVYYKENPLYLDRALRSVWDEQTIKPDEIVLVEDGKLTNELYSVIEIWEKKLDKKLKIVKIEKNSGLANALNEGLKHCSNEIIARMDTDDISLPNRFEKQLKIFKDDIADVCSAWIIEFDNDENSMQSIRDLPEMSKKINKYAKFRSPINHPVAMFKKSIIVKYGGYPKILFFEDYALWCKLLKNNVKFCNIQEVLLKMRANNYMYKRRRGVDYLKYEVEFLNYLKQIKFINFIEYLIMSILRLPQRLLPYYAIKVIYKKYLRKNIGSIQMYS